MTSKLNDTNEMQITCAEILLLDQEWKDGAPKKFKANRRPEFRNRNATLLCSGIARRRAVDRRRS